MLGRKSLGRIMFLEDAKRDPCQDMDKLARWYGLSDKTKEQIVRYQVPSCEKQKDKK